MVLAPHTPGPAWHCRARGWVSSQLRAGSFLGFTPTFGQTCSNQTLPSCRARWKPCVCHLTPASSRALLPLGFLLIEPKSCLPAARLGPHPALCSAARAGGAGRTGPPACHHQHHHPGKTASQASVRLLFAHYKEHGFLDKRGCKSEAEPPPGALLGGVPMSQPVGTGGDTAPRLGLLLSFAGARSGVALLPFQPPGVMSFSQLLLGSEGLSKILSPGGHFLWPCLWLQHPPPCLLLAPCFQAPRRSRPS